MAENHTAPTISEMSRAGSSSTHHDRNSAVPQSHHGATAQTPTMPSPLSQQHSEGLQHHQILPQPYHPHQSQMPYAPYPYPVYQQPRGRQLPHLSKAWIGTRIAFTVLSSVLVIAILAITGTLLSTGTYAGAVALYGFIIPAVAFLWNLAEFITYGVRVRKHVQRGIHPGAHVGLHLVFWLVGVFATILTVLVYINTLALVYECDYEPSSLYNFYYDDCNSQSIRRYGNQVAPLLLALTVIFALWTVVHFILFVLACIETARRNSLKDAAFVMPPYAQAPGAAPMPMQYYPYPMPMQPQQAHGGAPASEARDQQTAQTYQPTAGYYAPQQ